MNKISSKKLLNTKWTAVTPSSKERHFLITKLVFNCKLATHVSQDNPGIIRIYQHGAEEQFASMAITTPGTSFEQAVNVEILGSNNASRTMIIDCYDDVNAVQNNICELHGHLTVYGVPYTTLRAT